MLLIRPWGRSEKLPLTKLLNYFIVFVAVRVVYKNTHQHTSWRRTRRWSWWSSACSPCSPGRRSTPSGCSAWQGQPGFCELAPLTGSIITIAIFCKDTAIIIIIITIIIVIIIITCLVHSNLSFPSSIIGRSSLKRFFRCFLQNQITQIYLNQINKCSDLRGRGCAIVHICVILKLCNCVIVHLFNCAIAQFWNCPIVQLHIYLCASMNWEKEVWKPLGPTWDQFYISLLSHNDKYGGTLRVSNI